MTVGSQKILLMLLPFWDSLIPPLGIGCLKSYLEKHGYPVKTVDANVDAELKQFYRHYFDALQAAVPVQNRGNFYSTGHDVLRQQMMAFQHYEDEAAYRELVRLMISETFYCTLREEQVVQLDRVIGSFYRGLEEYMYRLLSREKPTVLGLSVFSGTFPASLFTFKLAKKYDPRLTTVMGGGIFCDQLAAGSPDFRFFLEKTEPYIDRLVIGEGEALFLKLLQDGPTGTRRVYTAADLGGAPLDLAGLESPDFSDFDIQHYPSLSTFGSRGCPYRCSFCSAAVFWGKFRRKPVRRIVAELTALYGRHRSQLFLFCDSLLNLFIDELARALTDPGLPVYWEGYLRAGEEACNDDAPLRWRRGGAYRFKMGLESGSARVLGLMGKKITPEQIGESLIHIAAAGIKTSTLWVVGHPGEREADFVRTLGLIEAFKDDIYEAECTPFTYHPAGQVGAEDWQRSGKSQLLYPAWAQPMLISQTRVLDCEPPRREIYSRVNRFVQHCRRLGIPNPYSLADIYQADRRWQKLHKNAVPPLLAFKGAGTVIDERKDVKALRWAANTLSPGGDFVF
jgi:hypothetical protein